MLRANLALLLCGVATPARADLPSELVARPATLPHGMSSLSLSGGYDEAHELGIRVLSATGMGLEARRGMTGRLELGVGIGLALNPDQGWTSRGDFGLTYAAWHGANIEVAP